MKPTSQLHISYLKVLKADVRRTYDMLDNSSRAGKIFGCVLSPGVHAVAVLRFCQWVTSLHLVLRILLRPLTVLLNLCVKVAWGIEVAPTTKIGEGFYIGHFGGIHISPHAVIGKNFTCSQGVTIGVSGHGDNHGAPFIGDDVYIAPGAKVYGRIRVGDNVKIGANAVVYKDIPPNAIVVLKPGFEIISYDGNISKTSTQSKSSNA